MAQGSGKLGKSKKSAGGQKKAVKSKKTLHKGRKQFSIKGKKKNSVAVRAELDTTKAINKRNEALVAAKAVSVGTAFFLSDIKEAGQNEIKAQTKQRNKKENKASKVSDRLKTQLKKLGKDV